jgi:hypothetical protein
MWEPGIGRHGSIAPGKPRWRNNILGLYLSMQIKRIP